MYPACRLLTLRTDPDGSVMYFRIPDTGSDSSMLAAAMTAIAANMKVLVSFSPGVTTGCGTSPDWSSFV